jgi:hypothetical protein
MDSSLDHLQMIRTRTMVLVLFFANLAGILTLFLDLIGFATMGAISLACWWLARLPLGREYRWFMGSSALAAAGALIADALAYPDFGPWREGPAALTLASGFFSLAAPLLLCQAMVLFSRRAGFAGVERAWIRARLAMLVAYGSWIALVAVERLSGLLSAIVESFSLSVQLALITLVSAAGILVLLFMLLALFSTQRTIGLATCRAAEHPKLA